MNEVTKRLSLWRVATALITAVSLASLAASGCAGGEAAEPNPPATNDDDDAGACPSGQLVCQDVCTDTKKDRTNCGACGSVCAPGNVCVNGKCALTCPGGLVECDGTCVNPQGDRFHCGGCNKACAAGEVCSAGRCAVSCQEGLTNCDGSCVNTDKDRENCGTCGNECGAGEVCSAGQCALSCQEGHENCEGSCSNVKADRDNCGACGNACQPGEVCNDGQCALSCPSTLTECNGACANLKTDRAHCGGCGQACPSGEVCEDGACKVSCQEGLSICNGICVSLKKDRDNCGTCGKSCKTGEVCSDGTCAISCQAELTNCSDSCVNTKTDRAHCGGCNKACDSGEVCNGGTCALSCQKDLTNCAGSCANLKTDRANCGGCGNVCNPGEVCSDGECALSCPDNLSNCDGACVNLKNDRSFCGACDQACSSTQSCRDGACICLPGQAACGNACVDLALDSNHCGGCNQACGNNQVCSSGGCQDIQDGNGKIAPAKPKVAFVASAGETGLNTNLKGKLGVLDMFETVDVISASTTLPTLAKLQEYDAIGLFSYLDFADPVAMGDRLADYLESGGGVVLFSIDTWSIRTGNKPMKGRYADKYALLPEASAPTSMSNLGTIVEPTSPLMAGVTVFKCVSSSTCYRNTGGPKNGAIVVANWADGKPFVLRRDFDGHKVVEMNLSPYFANGGWDATSHGATLVKNGLLYVVSDVMTAAPRLDLGTVSVFAPAPAKSLVYKNTSGASQVITAIDVTGVHVDDFDVSPTVSLPVTLAPGDTLDVAVVFTPSGTGLRAATVEATVAGQTQKLTTLLVGKGI